jgi:uncharacterized damage-inducible protein DinB
MPFVPVKVFTARLSEKLVANSAADADRAVIQSSVDAAQDALMQSLIQGFSSLQSTVAAIPQVDPAFIAGLQSSVDVLAAQQLTYNESLSTLQAFDANQATTNTAVAAELAALAEGMTIDDGEPAPEVVPA